MDCLVDCCKAALANGLEPLELADVDFAIAARPPRWGGGRGGGVWRHRGPRLCWRRCKAARWPSAIERVEQVLWYGGVVLGRIGSVCQRLVAWTQTEVEANQMVCLWYDCCETRVSAQGRRGELAATRVRCNVMPWGYGNETDAEKERVQKACRGRGTSDGSLCLQTRWRAYQSSHHLRSRPEAVSRSVQGPGRMI